MNNEQAQLAGCCEPSIERREAELPVAIIGAGPVGLAAAARLKERNVPFFLLERGAIAANVRSWAHVTLFSPWRYNTDEAAVRLLHQTGWQMPDLEKLPSGGELIDSYLAPLASLLSADILEHHEVVAITRDGLDRMKSSGRQDRPFTIHAETPCGLKSLHARAVIDATGTWRNPNPALSSGVWLKAEKELSGRIDYSIPHIAEYGEQVAGGKVAVVGGGHSAIQSLLNLMVLKERHPDTRVTWILRKQRVEDAFGGGEDDELEARGALGNRIADYVRSGQITVETPFSITGFREDGGVVLSSSDKELGPFDRGIVNTGSRPDFDFHRELRFESDAITEAVPALAPLIDPNHHSCGTVPPHGEKELRQPEPGFYIVGAKSYGRAPTFLMATGYEQVRSVTAFLAGDTEASQLVQLVLPETGVCHSTNGGCC